MTGTGGESGWPRPAALRLHSAPRAAREPRLPSLLSKLMRILGLG
ncbi:MAG TPA: hypothetical protein VHG28_22905 [Longimicrobiaceae bacterium]|nr:hypothetical protein [Longimicrobiaceae bacterium]